MSDALGDRIKRYEEVYNGALTPNSNVIIRVDGRSFHTFTRDFERPFDMNLHEAMVTATIETAREMSGFKLAYTQSDEATFVINDTDTFETQGWFGYNRNKLVSITASAFTAYFNRALAKNTVAMFDARAFVVPEFDTPNVFVWRQQDWERNSVQMYARAYFTHKELHNKSRADIHEMLHEKGLNWAHLSDWKKNGTWVMLPNNIVSRKFDYQVIDDIINGVIK